MWKKYSDIVVWQSEYGSYLELGLGLGVGFCFKLRVRHQNKVCSLTERVTLTLCMLSIVHRYGTGTNVDFESRLLPVFKGTNSSIALHRGNKNFNHTSFTESLKHTLMSE